MDTSKDYYRILGAEPEFSISQIKEIYRDFVRAFHPDVTVLDKEAAAERMKAINEAYDVLSDPVQRLKYDKTYSARNKATSQVTKSKDSTPSTKHKGYASEKQIRYARYLLHNYGDEMDYDEQQEMWEELDIESPPTSERIREIIDELKDFENFD